MNKGLAIAGGVLIPLSILGIIIGVVGIAGHGPDSENILHDTELDGNTFVFDGNIVLLEVYAKGEVDCYSYSVSVTDDLYEYFNKNCDAGTEAAGYTYLGDLEIVDAGDYIIDSDGDVVIIDADGLLAPIFVMCGGGFCCLVGIILLIIGLSVGRKAPQVVVFQQPDGSIIQQANQTTVQPYQTTVQQYVPVAQATSTEVVSVHQEEVATEQVEQTDYEPFSFEHKNKL